jgi:hypothetical protein
MLMANVNKEDLGATRTLIIFAHEGFTQLADLGAVLETDRDVSYRDCQENGVSHPGRWAGVTRNCCYQARLQTLSIWWVRNQNTKRGLLSSMQLDSQL